MGYLQFWATDFWSKLYQQSVYWFLGVLFAMFVVLALIYRVAIACRTARHGARCRPGGCLSSSLRSPQQGSS